jgi:CcmD family protein
MDNETYLFLAFGISWVVLAAYIWSMNNQARSLNDEVKSLRDQQDDEHQ